MNRGTVKWIDEAKGFGFIETDGGQEVFFHRSGLKDRILPGDIVFFNPAAAGLGDRGPKAVDVKRKRK